MIDLEKLVSRGDLDPIFLDNSYYLYPDGPIAAPPGPERKIQPSLLYWPIRSRFAPDSPLEEAGFELAVPRRIAYVTPST